MIPSTLIRLAVLFTLSRTKDYRSTAQPTLLRTMCLLCGLVYMFRGLYVKTYSHGLVAASHPPKVCVIGNISELDME